MTMSKSKSTNRATKSHDDAVADKFFHSFDTQPAPITSEQCDQIEADFLGLSKRRSRRAALGTLARSGSQLTETVADDRETAVAMARAAICISDYASNMREFADMMESASTRIKVALCVRPDMQALLKEAEAMDSGEEVAHG
jgi:hypothetical protein